MQSLVQSIDDGRYLQWEISPGLIRTDPHLSLDAGPAGKDRTGTEGQDCILSVPVLSLGADVSLSGHLSWSSPRTGLCITRHSA